MEATLPYNSIRAARPDGSLTPSHRPIEDGPPVAVAMKDAARAAPADATRYPPVAIFDNYWAPTLAFARSLGRRRVPLHFYGPGAGRWSRYCSRHEDCPPVEDIARFVPWLRQRVLSGAITRIAPTTDLITYYVSLLRDEFPESVRGSIAPLEEVERCLIKTRFASACDDYRIPCPPTRTPSSLEEAEAHARELGFPCIIKPNSHLVVGTTERGRLIRDAGELRTHFRHYEIADGRQVLAERYPGLLLPVVQRYVPSARRCVYSVSGFKDRERGIVASSLSYKCEQWPPDVGTSVVQVSCSDERISRIGLRMVDALITRGIFELELLADGEHLLPIDLNPRAFGFIELDIALGRDLPWLWFRSTLGEPAEETPPMPERALEARHRLLYSLRRLAGPRSARSASDVDWRARDRPRASISMLGHWSDPVPMWIGYAHQLRHPRSLIRSQFQYTARPPVA